MRRLSTVVVLSLTLVAAGCGTRVERSTTAASQQPGATDLGGSQVGGGGDTALAPVTDGSTDGGGGSTVVSSGLGAIGSPGGKTVATSPAAGAGGGSGGTAGAAGTGSSPAASGSGTGSAKTGGKTTTAPTPGVPGAGDAAPAPGGMTGAKPAIKIGEVGVFSGPIGTNMKPISDSVKIWVRWINDRGGLNGHPVSLLTGDSAGDPARHRALVQQLIERGVIAFVGQPGEVFSGGGSVEYITQQRVPVIGSEGAANYFYESPVYFPQIQHGRALVQALAVGAAKEAVTNRKLSKLALWTCVEAQTCKDIDEVVPKVTPKYGVKVVNTTKISIGQPDFTAECLSTRNSGAEMIFMAADGTTINRAAGSCARQGFRPTWVLVGATILAKQHAEDPNLNNGIGIDTQAPWFLDNTPARKEWRDALAKYAPDLVSTSSNMVGWVSAKLFEYAMRKAPQPYTREGLLASLWSIKGDPLSELTVPFIFNAEKGATATTCYWNIIPKDGKWLSADGGQRHCFDYDPSI